MNLLKRWRLRRELGKLERRRDHYIRIMPHAGFLDIARVKGQIRRVKAELAGFDPNPNQRKEKAA